MVKEIVKTAIEIKMTCKSVSPIISGGEYSYACGLALKELKADRELLEKAVSQPDIPSMQETVREFLNASKEKADGQPQYERLLHLLLTSKADDKMTDEMRDIFWMGCA